MSPHLLLPALLGGPPVRPAGPPDWPPADDDIRLALLRCHQDGSWGKYHGGNVANLEAELCRVFRCDAALACASGTFAVELALRGLGVGPGDEVILAAYDYPGNFLCIHAVGAQPVLVDVAPHNWNLDPENIAAALSARTRAVIASHLHGGLVPMRRLMDLAAAHGFGVIEDAAQSPGAVVEGKFAGTWGDVGVLSFGGSKLLSAGRGGAVLTSRADVLQRMRLAQFRGNLLNPLSELQAAVLLPQLAKLDARHARRGEQVAYLAELLRDLPGLTQFENRCEASSPAFYKVGFQYEAERFGLPRDLFLRALRAEGLAFDEGFRALHLGRSARRFRRATELPHAEQAHHGAVILHHPILLGGPADMEEIQRALLKIHAHAAELCDLKV